MDLYNNKDLRYILKKHNFCFKKKLGQNFLINKKIAQKISDLYDKSYNIIEVGPGIGHLTRMLSLKAKKILAVELDNDLIKIFNILNKDITNIDIINDDILKLDLINIYKKFFNSEKISLCANIPYYITSKLIFKLINYTFFESITLMLQKEVVERIIANVGDKLYGSFSIYINYFFEVKKILDVDAVNFIPQPKINSAVIYMKHNKRFQPNNEKLFLKLVSSSFLYKRKKMINSIIYSKNFNISNIDLKNFFYSLNISENIRAEEISIQEFIHISNLLSKYLIVNI